MAIQIEQAMPRCRRCGKLVHERDVERVKNELGLFCSSICCSEYAELTATNVNSKPAATFG